MPESTLIASEKNMTVLRCADQVIGHLLVPDSSNSGIDVTGRFVPGLNFEPCKALFETARDAAARVELVSDTEYLQSW